MSKDKPVYSFLYVCNDDLMQCDDYEWGHINTRVGKIHNIHTEPPGGKNDKS